MKWEYVRSVFASSVMTCLISINLQASTISYITEKYISVKGGHETSKDKWDLAISQTLAGHAAAPLNCELAAVGY
jgi:hypothetical protein